MKINAVSAFFMACTLTACNTNQQATYGFLLTDKQIEERIDELLPQLTMEEKVDLCHAQSKFSTAGVPRLGIPELWYSDGPHGVRGEVSWNSWDYAGWTNDSCTAFPALTALAATFNPSLANDYGVAIGEESKYRRKNVILGPGVNIYRTPLNGRNFEYMGEDPYLASTMVVPYVQGVQSTGTATCVKHYCLNNQETWRDHVNVTVSDRALREIYLPAFKAAIVEGKSWSIMGAYNRKDGQHLCHNQQMLNKILKEEWNFDGCVVTDWGGCHNLDEAVKNGLDIEMGTYSDGLTTTAKNFGYKDYYLANPYKKAIKEGKYTEKELNDKARRILRLILRTNNKQGFGRMTCDEHKNTAYNIGKEAVVLLQNNNSFLPIDAQTTQKILIVGENATRNLILGGGSSELKPEYVVSPLEGIQKRFPNAKIDHAKAYSTGPMSFGRVNPPTEDQQQLKEEALSKAKDADLIIFVGGLNKNHEQDCEAGDRKQIELDFGQEDLIKQLAAIQPNMVVILIGGNAIATDNWASDVKSIVYAWYLGSENGNIIADVLCGNINPSGKLPFSFPKKLSDSAPHSFADAKVYPGINLEEEYREGIFVGYRWHDAKQIEPLYEFGYGMSYTSFKVENESVSNNSNSINIKAKVTNTGNCNGAEVLQVYIGKAGESKVERCIKELKGFQKINLAPSQTKDISISVPLESLKFFNEKTQQWEFENGDYTVFVGTSSKQIAFTTTLKL